MKAFTLGVIAAVARRLLVVRRSSNETGMTRASVRRVPHARPVVEITIVLVAALLHAAAAAPQTSADTGPRPGTITGQVLDPVDAPVSGATVVLTRDGDASPTETVSDTDGRFAFVNVAAGRYDLTVSAPGFAASTVAGQLAPGGAAPLAPIRLTLSAGTVSIEVRPNRVIAEQQLKTQEQQRVFGIFQNFNISYDPKAVPLDARQKFQLAGKNIIDPVQYVWLAGLVGIQQARNDFGGFGGDEEGYAKRYAAATATILTGTVLSKAVLPIVFKQDPRYFYKGTGTTSSRVEYALSRALVRRGDDGRLRPDYSRILGHLAAGALSNLYYPPPNQQSQHLMLQYAALAIGTGAIDNLLQEFLLKRFTTHAGSASAGGAER
jgi:hypothetical protein